MTKATKILALATVSITRSGSVNWAVKGDFHCGPKALVKNGRIPVQYSMTAVCRPKLDARGFLFDQAMVDLWMTRLGDIVTELSCEALVIDIAERFMRKMAKDVPHCELVGLRLSLSPAPHAAAVTVRYGATVD